MALDRRLFCWWNSCFGSGEEGGLVFERDRKRCFVFEPGKEGCKDYQDRVERKKGLVFEPRKEGCKDKQDFSS